MNEIFNSLPLPMVTVPTTKEEDINAGYTQWRNGKCVSMDLGTGIMYYLGHYSQKQTRSDISDELPDEEIEVTYAFPVIVPKPISRDKAINAAEMAAYNLSTAMDVASFAASMSRKYRDNNSDPEVLIHDRFIDWAKSEFTKIGV